MWNRMWNWTSKNRRFECVIECETKCEIVHQSKRRFECVIECQIYYVNECGIECEIESQTEYKAQSVTECVIES